LQQANQSFDLMIYPTNRHGVTEPNQQFHMYQLMTNFLKRELARP
jgi:dipeptidyl aminopeptidase/acylaminoacyl peptidase